MDLKNALNRLGDAVDELDEDDAVDEDDEAGMWDELLDAAREVVRADDADLD